MRCLLTISILSPATATTRFDIIDVPVLWKSKDNNISPYRGFPWNKEFAGQRHPQAIDELVYQEVVTNLQGRQHRPGWNFKGLYYKCTDKESEQYSDNNCLNILPDYRFASYLPAQFPPLI